MVWIRIFILVFLALAGIYYMMLLAQIFSNGSFRFTNRRIEFMRCIFPFYYWIAPYDEKPKKEVKRVKPIVDNRKTKVESDYDYSEDE